MMRFIAKKQQIVTTANEEATHTTSTTTSTCYHVNIPSTTNAFTTIASGAVVVLSAITSLLDDTWALPRLRVSPRKLLLHA